MFGRYLLPLLMVGQAIVVCAAAAAQTVPAESESRGFHDAHPSDSLVDSLPAEGLRGVVEEVLARNPEIARATNVAAAAAARAPQSRALPDPRVALTAFALPVETRVGPQRLSLSLQQTIPWFGKLALAEQGALLAATAADLAAERIRLDKITETRRLAYEIAFLEASGAILAAERETLVRYESVSQARYAAGTGLQQEVVRIQAQITRTDARLLEISERRATLVAALNTLRDRPATTPVEVTRLPEPAIPDLDLEWLRRTAEGNRPELAEAHAEIAAQAVGVRLAEKGTKPDITFGLSYTLVEDRDDDPARINPPPGNGDDILAFTGSVNLPIRRRKLSSAVEEARASERAATEHLRRRAAEIEGEIGDLTERIPRLNEHVGLLEGVLYKQAREVLRSTETAYSTGKLNAVDLLDAEVVLFDVQISAARTRTDLAIALAELERAIAHPLKTQVEESPRHEP